MDCIQTVLGVFEDSLLEVTGLQRLSVLLLESGSFCVQRDGPLGGPISISSTQRGRPNSRCPSHYGPALVSLPAPLCPARRKQHECEWESEVAVLQIHGNTAVFLWTEEPPRRAGPALIMPVPSLLRDRGYGSPSNNDITPALSPVAHGGHAHVSMALARAPSTTVQASQANPAFIPHRPVVSVRDMEQKGRPAEGSARIEWPLCRPAVP
ncbi:hypothetical protein JZ751_008771 [Albula glossodonta]|uniref:Uncharacterized protein n=1 Tax=Albula glossodonta TaxID=121402 RepID=A0A8T2PAA6_9TELE|nr:hypothetical protein JZ751_008771 [Albula glossodonta]